jgi:hypothetical protein
MALEKGETFCIRQGEGRMEKMLHRLETFTARGSDGKTYAVQAYEHLVRVDAILDVQGHWEPTGQAEYRLADGRRVQVEQDGQMLVADSGVRLEAQTRH